MDAIQVSIPLMRNQINDLNSFHTIITKIIFKLQWEQFKSFLFFSHNLYPSVTSIERALLQDLRNITNMKN